MVVASSPVPSGERAEVLDALRGFALLGIFVTHFADFSGAAHPAVSEFLIRGKFLSLFAFLFGIGFAVQIDSAARRGASFNRHFIRRLTALFLIGLAHALVWYGDILKDYALLGLLLLLTARWSIAMLVRAAAIVLLLRIVWPALIWAVMPAAAAPGVDANPAADFGSSMNVFYSTDLAAAFNAN